MKIRPFVDNLLSYSKYTLLILVELLLSIFYVFTLTIVFEGVYTDNFWFTPIAGITFLFLFCGLHFITAKTGKPKVNYIFLTFVILASMFIPIANVLLYIKIFTHLDYKPYIPLLTIIYEITIFIPLIMYFLSIKYKKAFYLLGISIVIISAYSWHIQQTLPKEITSVYIDRITTH